MNLFETIIINIIFCLFPLLLYLFYLIFQRNVERRENDLILDVAILSSLYLIIRFSVSSNLPFTVVLINVPLVISYLKRRTMTPFIISSVIVVYLSQYFSIAWYYFMIEYALYYLIHLFINRRKCDSMIFTITFISLKFICYLWPLLYLHKLTIGSFTHAVILYLFFAISLLLTIKLFGKCEEIAKYYISKTDLEQERKIRSSLFRITHEIKNPIAVCKGYLDMFDVENPKHSKKYIPIMKDEINRTLLLLQDFLSISKVRIEKDYMDVNVLVEEVMNNFSLMLKEHNIEGNLNLVDDDIYIMGDYNRLTQVLINLLKNSVEAIPKERRGEITITTKSQENKFYLEIKDNGNGITKEVMQKIQEPFFTTKTNGTGLGVSLSREIIKAHDGQIVYESEPYQGTTVKIWLPIQNEFS